MSAVEGRIGEVDVLLVHLLLGQTHRLAEALEVDDLPLPEEADDVIDVGVVAEPEDVVIGDSGLLFCGHIFAEVTDHVALDADAGGIPREAGGGSGVDAGGVIHKIRGKGRTAADLLVGEIPGELVDDGADHLQVPQLLGAYRGTKMAPKAQNLCAATDSGNLSSAEYN